MQPERAELYCQQGSSDKVYHLQLEGAQDQWAVQAQWGRRGSALQSDVKVSGTSYEEAKRVYDRILREKTGKGYQVAHATSNGNEAIAVGPPATKEHSGHTPELLTPIEEPEALLLAQDASWWFQQKFDGRRLAVQKSEGKYSGINKLGQIIPIDSRLAESLDRVQAQSFLVDGEITDSCADCPWQVGGHSRRAAAALRCCRRPSGWLLRPTWRRRGPSRPGCG